MKRHTTTRAYKINTRTRYNLPTGGTQTQYSLTVPYEIADSLSGNKFFVAHNDNMIVFMKSGEGLKYWELKNIGS